MKTNIRFLFSRRATQAILIGVVASVALMFFLPNDMLSAVLGALVTLIIATQRQPVEMSLLGLVTGALSGIYWGVTNLLAEGAADQRFSAGRWALAVLGGSALFGLLCAVCGFVTGKFIELYKKGQGPFF